MLELVFAPADDWIGRSDDDIVHATMLVCTFPWQQTRFPRKAAALSSQKPKKQEPLVARDFLVFLGNGRRSKPSAAFGTAGTTLQQSSVTLAATGAECLGCLGFL